MLRVVLAPQGSSGYFPGLKSFSISKRQRWWYSQILDHHPTEGWPRVETFANPSIGDDGGMHRIEIPSSSEVHLDEMIKDL